MQYPLLMALIIYAMAAGYGSPLNGSLRFQWRKQAGGRAGSDGEGVRRVGGQDVVFNVLGESRIGRDGFAGRAFVGTSGGLFHDDPLALRAATGRSSEYGSNLKELGPASRETDVKKVETAKAGDVERDLKTANGGEVHREHVHGSGADKGYSVGMEGGVGAGSGSLGAEGGGRRSTTMRQRALLQEGYTRQGTQYGRSMRAGDVSAADAEEQGERQSGVAGGYAPSDLGEKAGQEVEMPTGDADGYYDEEVGEEDFDDDEMAAGDVAVEETEVPDGLWLLGLVAAGLMASLVHALAFALIIYGGPSLLQACESLRLVVKILVTLIWVDGGDGGVLSPPERGAASLLIVVAGAFVIRYCARWVRGWGNLQVPIAVYNMVSLGDLESSVTRQMGNVEKKFSITSITPSPSLFSPTPANDGSVPQRWACRMFLCIVWLFVPGMRAPALIRL